MVCRVAINRDPTNQHVTIDYRPKKGPLLYILNFMLNFRKNYRMKGILIAFVLTLLSSCIGKEIQASIAQVQIPQVEYQPEIASILDSFVVLENPIFFDTTFFLKNSKFDFENGNLSSEVVQILTQKFAKDEISARENYYINAFIEIEEAKKNEQYAEFQEILEGGMTENAVCRSLGRIELGDSVGLLLWEIKYKSFDAPPTYQGHHVLGTIVYQGNTISCMHLASNETGADIPMRFESYQLASVFKNGKINVQNFAQTHENGVLIEETAAHSHYQLTSKGFELTK